MLPYLKENGIAVVVRGPLRMGLLTGKFNPETTFLEGDIRKNWPTEPWFKDSLEKVEHLRKLEKESQTMGQGALRFVLSHPAVSVAIPGAKTPQQVTENVEASVRPLLSNAELEVIDRYSPALLK